jgi:poly(hydroxyalkanoate) depolymerase family esterase
VAVTAAAASLVLAGQASAASLVQIFNFGSNPTNLNMHLYVPDNIPAGTRPPILVAVHYCTGSGPAFYSGTQFASLADQYKFIVIYPSATRSGNCFDVSSPGALRHNGTSDPVGIVSMVNWVVANRNGDANRVYATGASSGGMMTNVLLGDYPDVFKAGAAFMGVPFACFATTDGSMWNSQCANGQRIMTPQQWGDLVRNAFPGYTGARPRMQIWHGTNDTTLRYPNFGEQIKQWTNVFGLSQTPTMTDTPQAGWTRTRYGGTGVMPPVEAISIANTGHNLPLAGQAAMAIAFFGLNTTPPTTTTTTITTTTTSRPPTTTTTTTTTTSRPPTTTTTTAPTGACTATYRLVNPWTGGFQAEVTVRNNGSTSIGSWTVALGLGGGQSIVNLWNGVNTGTTGAVTVRNAPYNGTIPGNGTTTFGFVANGPSTPTPTVSCSTP